MFINELFNKKQLNEGLRSGEYYQYKIYFDDGTTTELQVTSDEFDFDSYYAKRGKNVDKVELQGGIRSDFDEGVAEGLPQTLRKIVPGYAKREIDKKMDAGKFGRDDVAKDANYYRYKKIQDKLKEQGVAEGSVYKKDQDLSSISTQELEAFVKKHWAGGIPTWGQGESVKRAMRELRRRQKPGVAEGISVVDQDYDLDQIILTLDIEGKKVSFTYWDYDENFANAKRKDVFDQLQKQPWYARLDHPTRMEILDAAYRAIRGLEPQEYRPTVRDEPLDEQGVAEGSLNEGVMDQLKRIYMMLVSDLPMGTPESEFLQHWQRIIQDDLGKKIDINTLSQLRNNFINRYKTMGRRGDAGDWHREMGQDLAEGSAQDRLHQRHQELRKKRGLPDPKYYQELKATYDLPDQERYAKTAELKKKYGITNEDVEQYIEELERAGYEIITEAATLCPECGGAAYADQMLAEKQDACYHKVKSRYKVWPSAYASGALVRCRKVGAANWGNKSKK